MSGLRGHEVMTPVSGLTHTCAKAQMFTHAHRYRSAHRHTLLATHRHTCSHLHTHLHIGTYLTPVHTKALMSRLRAHDPGEWTHTRDTGSHLHTDTHVHNCTHTCI